MLNYKYIINDSNAPSIQNSSISIFFSVNKPVEFKNVKPNTNNINPDFGDGGERSIYLSTDKVQFIYKNFNTNELLLFDHVFIKSYLI